jgi:cysteine sulfinate desulfinase/cysteine desulfurase-like protein
LNRLFLDLQRKPLMSACIDVNETTHIDDGVLGTIMPCLRAEYGSTSSRHDAATRARDAFNAAREQVAALASVKPSHEFPTAIATRGDRLRRWIAVAI